LREADIIFAQQLAAHGYVTLVPAFMAAYGITSETRRSTFTSDADPIFADLVDALGVLAHQPLVNGAKLGAVGFSNGGYFAVWLALTGHVGAAVSYYGAYSGAGADDAETRFRKAANANAAPILILHGLNDDTVPVEAARRLAGILDGAHAAYEMQLYPATGHSFDRGGLAAPIRPNGRTMRADPNGDTGDRAAEADAWTRTLAFFEKFLR
jgi:dienelactone hydrolase